jgi:hypothetical protein
MCGPQTDGHLESDQILATYNEARPPQLVVAFAEGYS